MCETTGVHSTRASSSMHGVVSPSHPFCPLRTHILHPPCKQLLTVVVWGAGRSWSSSLTPSSLMHPYHSRSTLFHPTSNCSWQQLGVLHGVGCVISSPPSSLSSRRLTPPSSSLSSCVLPSLLSLVPAGIVLALAALWCSCQFAGRGSSYQ
jgi:hypothetical protein